MQPPPSDQQEKKEKKHDRIFWFVPNYTTVVGAENIKPISPKEKFSLTFYGIVDPFSFAIAGGVSGISQARNSEPAWGQGWGAYSKRYWASYADRSMAQLMTTGVFPTLFRQDPRYFQLGRGSFIHRFNYAISRLFVTRTDSGRQQFNYSQFAGIAASTGISNLYYPSADRNFDHNMKGFGTQVALYLLSNELKEFWPDIRKKFSKRR
jgi:hypothetical protein